MRLQNARKITLEQVPQEQQQAIGMVASILNRFMEDVVYIVNGNVSFDNLSRKVIKLAVQTNGSGELISGNEVKIGFVPVGVNVGNIYMTDNPSMVPNITDTPFVCFSPLGNGIIKITKVLNLQKNSKYTLVLEFY